MIKKSIETALLFLTFVPCLLAAGPVVAQTQPTDVFRDTTPPDLLEDIAHFDTRRGMAASEATRRIIERGPAQVPAILAALEDVASNGGTSTQAQHLLTVFAALGDARHAEEFVVIARRLIAGSMGGFAIYDALHAIGAPEKADALALEVIADADSDRGSLLAALSRYWYAAPANVAEQALQHIDDESLMIRSAVYRVAFVAGLTDRIRDQIIEDVTNVNQIEGSVATMMNVMAAMEPEAEFKARVETLNLNPGVRNAALLMNEFAWGGRAKKEELLPKMLQSSVSELRSTAIAYLLESDRGDLLVKHRLAHVVDYDPFAIYRDNVPGFDNMSRAEQLEMIGEETFALLEAQAEEIGTVSMDRRTRYVAARLGLTLVSARGGKSVKVVDASSNRARSAADYWLFALVIAVVIGAVYFVRSRRARS